MKWRSFSLNAGNWKGRGLRNDPKHITSYFATPDEGAKLSVLGAILFGLATPSEAAAIGAFGALILAGAYRSFTFSAVFALQGGYLVYGRRPSQGVGRRFR